MHFFSVWSVVAGVVIHMAIGMLWYSPVLFGNQWLKLIGKTKEDISSKEASSAMGFAIIPAVASSVLLVVVLGLTNAQYMGDAIIVALITSAGFVGMSAFNLALFEGRSAALVILNTGYTVTCSILTAIATVLIV
jgi:hypothetical protein